jgi:hypothetical protein
VKRFLALTPCAFVAALASGCVTDNTTTGVTPITGIIVRSDSLITGRGCGTADGEMFKYLAVVTWDSATADPKFPGIAGIGEPGADVQQNGLYDCFADATFANLNTDNGTRNSFHVSIFAFDAAAYAAASSVLNCVVQDQIGMGACGQPIGETLQHLATATTVCTAQWQASVSVLAVCDPLK